MTETVDTTADDAVATDDVNVDDARRVGVAVPPASKAEYLEASQELQPGYIATVDANDPSIGWTAQHLNGERDMAGDGDAEVRAFVDPSDDTPGQVYLPEQLPDPKAAVAAGMAPVKIPEYLITEDADHIQGPEPSELVTMEHRKRLRRGVVSHLRRRAGEDVDGDEVGVADDDAPSGSSGSKGGKGLTARSTPASQQQS